MSKLVRTRAGIPSKVVGRAPTERVSEKNGGLVLDDFLAEIHRTRRHYNLPEPKFAFDSIVDEVAAKSAAEKIIKNTLDRHGTGIYSKPDPFLDQIYDIRCGEPHIKPNFYSAWQIVPAYAPAVLRRLLEIALQTIVQLPKRDAPLKDGTRELKLLALHCNKLADEIDRVFKTREITRRASTYFNSRPGPGLDQLFLQAEELRRTAETVRAILANTRFVKQKTDSPNPQARLALYVIGWFEASTGKKQYASLKTLLSTAFSATQEKTPVWVDRLEIEMNRHRARRKAWIRSITCQIPVS